YVNIFRRNVKIAAEHGWRGRIDRFAKPASESIEPGELSFIERRSYYPAVRRVHANDTHIAALSRNHTGLGERFVVADIGRLSRPQWFAEIRNYGVDATAAGNRDSVPSPFTVVGQLVAGIAEHGCRRVCIGKLRLLHHEHVRRGPVEPPDDF